MRAWIEWSAAGSALARGNVWTGIAAARGVFGVVGVRLAHVAPVTAMLGSAGFNRTRRVDFHFSKRIGTRGADALALRVDLRSSAPALAAGPIHPFHLCLRLLSICLGHERPPCPRNPAMDVP